MLHDYGRCVWLQTNLPRLIESGSCCLNIVGRIYIRSQYRGRLESMKLKKWSSILYTPITGWPTICILVGIDSPNHN